MRYSFQDRPVSKFGPPIWNCDKSLVARRARSAISDCLVIYCGYLVWGYYLNLEVIIRGYYLDNNPYFIDSNEMQTHGNIHIEVKSTWWRQKVRHDVNNTSWRQTSDMKRSKICHYLKQNKVKIALLQEMHTNLADEHKWQKDWVLKLYMLPPEVHVYCFLST